MNLFHSNQAKRSVLGDAFLKQHRFLMICFFFLLGLKFNFIAADSFVMHGQVQNRFHLPVHGVIFVLSDIPETLTTDLEGRFRLAKDYDSLKIRFRADHYQVLDTQIVLRDSSSQLFILNAQLLPSPTALKAMAQPYQKVTISWESVIAPTFHEYRIYRTKQRSSWTVHDRIGTTKKNSFLDLSPPAESLLYYWVTVVNIDAQENLDAACDSTFLLQNHPPRFIREFFPDTVIMAGQTYQSPLKVIDENGDPLLFQMIKGPPNFLVDPKSGGMRWKARTQDVGAWEVKVKVSDTYKGADTLFFILYVLEAVHLQKVENTLPWGRTLKVIWNISRDPLFKYYRVYRSISPETSDTSTLVKIIEKKQLAAVIDSSLEENKSYYYRIYAVNQTGLKSESNIVGAKTVNGNATPVQLLSAQEVSAAGFTLLWSKNHDLDFGAYLIYQASRGYVDTIHSLIATIKNREDSFFTVKNIPAHSSAFFRVFTKDQTGLMAGSNTVQIKTKSTPPMLIQSVKTLNCSIMVSDEYKQILQAKDSDGDTISFALLRNPPGMQIDDKKGTITWKPALEDTGHNLIKIVVADRYDGLDTINYDIFVWFTAIKTAMPTPRCAMASAVLDNKIYVIGGRGPQGYLLTVEIYDPLKDRWRRSRSCNEYRINATACVANGKIYLFGGYNSRLGYLSSMEVYDPAIDRWESKRPMSVARGFLSSAVVEDKIYVIGGGNPQSIDVVEEYDLYNDQWTLVAPMSMKRNSFSAEVYNNEIYVFGGCCNYLNAVEKFNPKSNLWTERASLPTARGYTASGLVGESIYVLSGRNDLYLNNVEAYYPPTNEWVSKPPLAVKRYNFVGEVVNGKIYIIGGYNQDEYLSTVEEYTPAKW